jgi:hypothetical protein
MIHSGLSKETGTRRSSGGCHEVYRRLLCSVLEISILLSFLHSKLSSYFPSTWFTLYSLDIFENNALFRKTNLVICSHHKSCWRPRHACIGDIFGFKKKIWSPSEGSVPVIFISVVYTGGMSWSNHLWPLAKHVRELVNLDNSVSQETKKQTNLATFVYRRLELSKRQPSKRDFTVIIFIVKNTMCLHRQARTGCSDPAWKRRDLTTASYF